MYRCPKCQASEGLQVIVQQWAELNQSEDNIETDVDAGMDHDHTWGESSVMACTACQFRGRVFDFDGKAVADMPPGRTALTSADLAHAAEALLGKALMRARQKSLGGFASNMETAGWIQQELNEFHEAFHQKADDADKIQELLDIGVAAIWGAASIRAKTIDY